MQGTPNDLYKSNVGFVELVGISETEHKENAEKFERSNSIHSIQSHSSKSLSMDQNSEDSNKFEEKDKGIPVEPSSKGKVKGSMFVKYFTAGVKWSLLVVLLFSFLFAQIIASTFDYFVSIW